MHTNLMFNKLHVKVYSQTVFIILTFETLKFLTTISIETLSLRQQILLTFNELKLWRLLS